MIEMTTTDQTTSDKAATLKKKAEHGLRITVTMEAANEEAMAWALGQGFMFAAERWIGVTVSRKDDPTTRVSCRTTRLRKRNRRKLS